MKKDLDQTVVIFRKYKEGDVIALFPYLPDSKRFLCNCYQMLGGHASADYLGVTQETKPATPEEYAKIFDELTHYYGYNLKVQKKASYRKMCKR